MGKGKYRCYTRLFNHNDAINEFKTAMLERGLLPPSSLVADGRIHRCGTLGRERGKDGVYCFYLNDGIPAGWFKNHRTGDCQTWSLKTSRSLTRAEQTAFFECLAQDRQRREAERSRQGSRGFAITSKDSSGMVDYTSAFHADNIQKRAGKTHRNSERQTGISLRQYRDVFPPLFL